jgi:uncharacterized membrane protein YbhN (UPF0104 family)
MTALSRPKLILSALALAALAAAALSPQLLGAHVASAFEALRGAERHWLLLAAAGFVAAFACTVGAWRAALQAAGGRICPKQAAARLAIGSMVNSFAPAKLGDAVKVALCSKAIDAPGSLWTTGGVYAALAATRSLLLAALLVVAFATGAMPLWPVFVILGAVAALAIVAALSGRFRRHKHVAQVLGGLAALERSPRALVAVLGWSAGMMLCRLTATMAIAAALGIPHPALAALLILPALDVASAFPVTPGSIGVGSGAVAVALASRGIGMNEALGVGFAIQAVETLVSVTTGTLGVLYLTTTPAVRRWSLRIATVGASVGVAAAFGLLVLDRF